MKTIHLFYYLILFQLTICQIGYSQSNHFYLQLDYQNGYVLPSNFFLAGDNLSQSPIDQQQVWRLKFAKQAPDTSVWKQLLNFPLSGFGVFRSNFYNKEELGNPMGLYAFLQGSFLKRNKLSLNYNLSMGFWTNWKYFDPVSNPHNVSIGGNFGIYIDVGLDVRYQLNAHFDAIFGASYNHFSNGNLRMPNGGINSILGNVGLYYYLKERPTSIKRAIPAFFSYSSFDVSSFVAIRNALYRLLDKNQQRRYARHDYKINAITATYNYHFSHLSSIGLGSTIYYNTMLNAKVDDEGDELIVEYADKTTDKIEWSIYPSYELRLSKVGIVI